MEATNNQMNMGGTIRAKVLKYKADGNTLTEKWETLTKYAEGIYYNLTTPTNYEIQECNIILEIRGVFWEYDTAQGNIFCTGHYAHRRWVNGLRMVVDTFPDIIIRNAEKGMYINNLNIEVMRRLGYDITALRAAREECIKQREERDRQQAEEAERRERERKELDLQERVKKAKMSFLAHKEIRVDEFELLARSVGYIINIRTLGTMRKRLLGVIVLENGVPAVRVGKRSSGLDGSYSAIQEVYDLIKTQSGALLC